MYHLALTLVLVSNCLFFFFFFFFCRKPSEFVTMAVTDAESPHLGEITCGTLLQKLQVPSHTEVVACLFTQFLCGMNNIIV